MASVENIARIGPSGEEQPMEMVAVERRIQARIEVDIPITLEIDSGSYACRLEDISIDGSGALVSGGSVRVDLGNQVRLRVAEPGVSVTAGVRWIADGGISFGVEFDDATIGAIVAGYAKVLV